MWNAELLIRRRHETIQNPISKIQNCLVSAVRQHFLDPLLVAFADQHIDVQNAFPLVRLLCQNVARMAVTAFEFTARGGPETLRGALMCF